MKVLIIGGVAAGAGVAARLRRLDETARIVMFERGRDEPEPATPGFTVLDTRDYGAARVLFLKATSPAP